MNIRTTYNIIVAALTSLWLVTMPVHADDAELDNLFDSLRDPGTTNWERVEQDIERHFANSGSASADLLLRRGMDALEAEDYAAAIDHFTALTDHAPGFAEGWNSRAAAYYLSGLYGPAIADLMHVLMIEPRHFGALGGLGVMLEGMDEPRRALAAYRAAFAIHPHQPELEAAIERLERATEGTAL